MTVASYEYEQSSEDGRERHVLIPWSRLIDTTPTKGQAACVNGVHATHRITGTVVNAGTVTVDPYVILNIAEGRRERKSVRNVLTYSAGPVAEATWGLMNIGDPVYYDGEQDTLNGVKLSTARVQSDAATINPFFGWVTMTQDEDEDDFPKAAADAGSTTDVALICAGLNVGI